MAPDFSWSKDFIISKISRTPEVAAYPGANLWSQLDSNRITTCQINNAKLYVLVVTLSINNKIKFSENLKQEFKRTISWNNNRSEMTTQSTNNNLD